MLEVLGRSIAEELEGVAALNEREALGEEAFQLDGADLSLPDRAPMDLGLATLPSIIPYGSDRNRTSPIAFTADSLAARAS